MTNEFGDGGSCRFQILTGIEVRRIFLEVLSDRRGHSHSEVGVDVYFAYCHRSGLTKHFFGYAFRSGHISAVFVDLVYEILRNAACAVQYDREFGKTFADFFENVKTKFGFALELVRAVAGSDCDGKRIYAGFFDEFLYLVGIGISGIFFAYVYRVFDTCESAEFRFDYYAVVVSVFYDVFGDFDVFFKRMM